MPAMNQVKTSKQVISRALFFELSSRVNMRGTSHLWRELGALRSPRPELTDQTLSLRNKTFHPGPQACGPKKPRPMNTETITSRWPLPFLILSASPWASTSHFLSLPPDFISLSTSSSIVPVLSLCLVLSVLGILCLPFQIDP